MANKQLNHLHLWKYRYIIFLFFIIKYDNLRGHDKVAVRFLNFLRFLSHAILLSPAVLSAGCLKR